MKKLLNKAEDFIRESLLGLQEAHRDLIQVSFEPDYIKRAKYVKEGKVALLSGGGSGHEPLHGGYVGLGMLDAACPGDVFTSPTPDQMEAATKAVHAGKGVLHIVKNYTGDVLNFEMAADSCKESRIEVEAVVIDDDVAVKDSLYTAGRRGVGATVFVEKICGASAEDGHSLSEIVELAKDVNSRSRSMGMALTSCTPPAKGSPIFDLGENEIEIGIGIHGEPGRERKNIQSAKEIVGSMTEVVLSDLPFRSGDSVVVMINGMGGTPLSELYLAYHETFEILKGKGIQVARNLVGNYITSLEMQGFSVTMMKADDRLLKFWDAPVHTPGLRWGV